MKLRTQLVLACFILSVLPLTVIVVYSHHTSKLAVETAYQKEAARMTQLMDRRLGAIRSELDQRLAEISTLPLQDLPAGQGGDAQKKAVGNILVAMGESAALVDTLEFLPVRPPSTSLLAAQPKPKPKPKAKVDIDPDPDPDYDVDIDIDDDDKQITRIELPEIRLEPIVIELPPRPKMPKFTFTPEQRALMIEVSQLGQRLGQNWNTLPPEQRETMQKELAAKQAQLHAGIEETRRKFDAEMAVASKELAEYEALRQKARAERDAQRVREREQQKAREEEEKRKQKAIEERLRSVIAAAPPAPAPAAVAETPAVAETAPVAPVAPATPVVKIKRDLSPTEKADIATRAKQAGLLFGKGFDVPVRSEGTVVGQIRANISTEEVLRRVLGTGGDDRDEVAFAVDRDGNLYTRNAVDRQLLDRIGVPQRIRGGKSLRDIPNWIVGLSHDAESGLRVGVARPVGDNLEELRNTAARNFGYGLALIAFALVGILPFANHITRDVNLVANGAERIAHGDLMTRLPVRSKNEFGQLAAAFNQMAEDLSHHQQRIVEQERERKEQEMQQRILAIEYDRKTVELEDARRFQLSMLPKELPRHERFDVGVLTQTATEVGGDYYDFHVSPEGVLSVTIGDATGHGAKAGTMVTVIKTLFAGYAPQIPPAHFLGDAATKIKRMELGRMAMALSLAQFDGDKLTVAAAGMPPVLIHRAATGEVEEIALEATPLGTLGVDYEQTSASIASGDTVLLMTDGFPELQNAMGQQLGYGATLQEFAAAATAPDANGVVAALASAAERWHGEQPPNDDVTFVVVRVA